MSTCIGDRPEQLDVASLTLPTEHIEFELGPPLRQAAWPTDLRKVLLNGMIILKDHAHLVSPTRRQHPYVWLRDFILAQTRGYDEDMWSKSGRIVIIHRDADGRPAGCGIDKTNKVIQAKVQTLERNLSRTQWSYITRNLHEATPTAPTDSLHSLACRPFSPPTPIPLLIPLSPPRHPLLPRQVPLQPAFEETVDSERWNDTILVISKDRIRKEMDDQFRLGVTTRGKGTGPHPPGELRVETRAMAPPGLLLAFTSSTVPPTFMSLTSLPIYIQGLVHAPPEPIDTMGSWSHMDIYQYSSIYYVELPVSLPANATQRLGASSQQGLPSAKGQLGVESDLWISGSTQNGLGETKARSAVYWRPTSSSDGDEPQHLEQYDQLEAVEWELVQDDQAQKSALVIRQFASGFFDIIGGQLAPAAVQDLSPFIIVIDITQTIGGLLRHPTHDVSRIIIELSTAMSPLAVPGTVRILAPAYPRQATISMGGAPDATSFVTDSAPFWTPEDLETTSIDSTIIKPPPGNSRLISTAYPTSALHPSSSHAKRLMLRNSGRPYPPIQLPAQRWEGEPSAFAPQQVEGFAGTSGHHQSNEMRSIDRGSKQSSLRRESFPFDAGADSGIHEPGMAGNPTSVVGLMDNTCPLGAPRAAGPSVIATSHWSTTTQSNGELQAFPCHNSFLSKSDQCGPSTITFQFTQPAPSHSQLPRPGSVYDLAMPLHDTVEHADLQQSLLFQLNPQLRPPPIGIPVVSFYNMPASESGTDYPYHPMSRVAHASTMSECFTGPFEHGANGSTSASDYI